MQKSGYIEYLKKNENKPDFIGDLIKRTIDYCWQIPKSELPSEDMMHTIGSPSEFHFRSAMVSVFHEMVLRGNLHPNSSILDIGSGCGRIAIPFSYFLNNGKYYGIDVWKEGIDWCKNNINPKNSNFNFIKKESNNNYYFDEKKSEEKNYYDLKEISSNSIDFCFAISLFTHLKEWDCYSYFGEIRRVLSESGCAYITCFIIDDFFFDFVQKTGMHTLVRQEEPGCYYAYSGQDFFAGYTERAWLKMIEDSGLRIISKDVGSWAEKPGAKNYQDTYIVTSNTYKGPKIKKRKNIKKIES